MFFPAVVSARALTLCQPRRVWKFPAHVWASLGITNPGPVRHGTGNRWNRLDASGRVLQAPVRLHSGGLHRQFSERLYFSTAKRQVRGPAGLGLSRLRSSLAMVGEYSPGELYDSQGTL